MPSIQKTLKILEFIRTYQTENRRAPTLEEIGHKFEMRSLAGVQHHINEMRRRGWIKRTHYSRTIEIVKEKRRAA
jgi:SOS-response transcriptional repressor LexA